MAFLPQVQTELHSVIVFGVDENNRIGACPQKKLDLWGCSFPFLHVTPKIDPAVANQPSCV
jgi:hypothetical protein